ncbi:MAG: hypothetical protein ACRD1H_01935, partial [Vicinamibacterales bacterium]
MAVNGDARQPDEAPTDRVWAEERATGQVLLTWQRAPSETAGEAVEEDHAAEARAVAATLGVRQGVTEAVSTDDGVLVTFDPNVITKQELARSVRAALNLDADLKTRGNELMKRVPAYLNLARSLALDERVSPV